MNNVQKQLNMTALGQNGQLLLTYAAWWGYGVVFVSRIQLNVHSFKTSDFVDLNVLKVF